LLLKTFIPVSRIFDNEDNIFIFSRNVRKTSASEILLKEKKIKNRSDTYCQKIIFKTAVEGMQLWVIPGANSRQTFRINFLFWNTCYFWLVCDITRIFFHNLRNSREFWVFYEENPKIPKKVWWFCRFPYIGKGAFIV